MKTSSTSPATDSPWFWIFLFGSMALAMAATIQPKFAQRYQRLERMQQARSRAALGIGAPDGQPAGESGVEDEAAAAGAPNQTGSLAGLIYFLAGLLFLAAIVMAVGRARGNKLPLVADGETP